MNDTLIHEIVLRFRGGASMRQIARSLHVSRRTVRQVLDRVDQARITGPAPEEFQVTPRPVLSLPAHEERQTEKCHRGRVENSQEQIMIFNQIVSDLGAHQGVKEGDLDQEIVQGNHLNHFARSVSC